VQIIGWERNELAEGATSTSNAKDCPIDAVFANAGFTPVTSAAADIDFAGDTLANPGPVSRRADGLDHPNEFVARDSTEVGITFQELQVGAADSCHSHANATLAARLGSGHILQRH
jgi:hypothetical protein